jgi:N-methylhydantoinase A
MRVVRIGIDVGGTFTDAVAIDDATYELVGQIKVPTTHTAAEGVALGIVQALQQLMDAAGIVAEQVRFIAHGTTQATNALLEGDVVLVGIVATGEGLEGKRARSETRVDDLELAPGKRLRTLHAFVQGDQVTQAINTLKEQGARVIVAAEPFSVDDPTGERRIMEVAEAAGLPATGTHEITKLYGLRTRTRTAVVNASILPRMVETADMTEVSVQRTGISAPLMIMRGDGGVMTVGEVRQRPILTMLSGPAAGVAGALMYEKVSDGIFLEVGGTSTDVSAVRGGQVIVEYAEVGGHKTYVSSLDVRTVGLAGGSMIRVAGGRVTDVGPRSAHIAGLPYSVYADPSEIVKPVLEYFAPREGDPTDYVSMRCANGKRFALTTACAANLLGYVQPDHYAAGNRESAMLAFTPLAAALGCTVEEAARSVLRIAANKVAPVVDALLQRYGLAKQNTVLVGGGGGCAAVVPFLAESMGMQSRLARNHQVISPIGVALALVRDVVERTIPYATEEDILRVRKEAEEAAIRSGAAPGTVEVQVEVDAARNIVRAIATGATELRTKNLMQRDLAEAELRTVAATSMGLPDAELVAHVGRWYVYRGMIEEKAWLGLKRRSKHVHRILDAEGVVRLTKDDLQVQEATAGELAPVLEQILARSTTYGDAGAIIPEIYLLCAGRMIDFTGLHSPEQVSAMSSTEIAGLPLEEPVAIVSIKRK